MRLVLKQFDGHPELWDIVTKEEELVFSEIKKYVRERLEVLKDEIEAGESKNTESRIIIDYLPDRELQVECFECAEALKVKVDGSFTQLDYQRLTVRIAKLLYGR